MAVSGETLVFSSGEFQGRTGWVRSMRVLHNHDLAEEIRRSGTSAPRSRAYSPMMNFDSSSHSSTGFSLRRSKMNEGMTSSFSIAPLASSCTIGIKLISGCAPSAAELIGV